MINFISAREQNIFNTSFYVSVSLSVAVAVYESLTVSVSVQYRGASNE
jgi:hypothetical protein